MQNYRALLLAVALLLAAGWSRAMTELHSQRELSRTVGVFAPSRYVQYKGSDDSFYYFQETGKFGFLGPTAKYKIAKNLIAIRNPAAPRVITYDQNHGEFHLGTGTPNEEVIKANFPEQYTREEENYLTAVDRLKRYEPSDASERHVDAVRQAMIASYRADHLDAAATYANTLLTLAADERIAKHRDGYGLYSDTVYVAHTMLGLLAIKTGDVEEAKTQLIASARVPGSPVLGSFGPDTVLARAVLEAGGKQAVLEYLRLCGTFWKRDELRQWQQTIDNGGMPPFDRYLAY